MDTIKFGDTGNLVVLARKLLNAWDYYLPQSEAFDEQMYFAVADFQRELGLDDDGIIGPNTWNALGNEKGSQKVGVTASGDIPFQTEFNVTSSVPTKTDPIIKTSTSPKSTDHSIIYLSIAALSIAYFILTSG